jgi:hypothetical protein
LLISSKSSLGFDTTTHAAMTSEAIKALKSDPIRNLSGIATINQKLGLYDKSGVLGIKYIDIGTTLTKRTITGFETKIMKDVRDAIDDIPEPDTIPGWIVRGAIREDDNTIETPQGNTTGSGDEPGGVFERVVGHFFDPVNNAGLSAYAVVLGDRSVDWALKPGAKANGRENHYKITDAREAMWRALTLTEISANGSLTKITPIGGLVSYAADEAERKAYWATMFRAVGDVVHLLQDLGQPQHTRNDAHSGLGCAGPTCLGGHASFVESYFKARTLQSGQFSLDEGLLSAPPGSGAIRRTTAPQLPYGGYTPPTFNKYADYFSTGEGSATATGQGLANYSNRGFYSFGTGINGNLVFPYPSPSPTGAGLGTLTIAAGGEKDMTGKPLQGAITFRTGSVVDTVTNTAEPQVRLMTVGTFDEFLQQRGIQPRYSLNSHNYDDQAKLLIPRAVGYSAGLIDYFFRGTLEIKKPTEGVFAAVDHAKPENQCTFNPSTNPGCGFKKIKMKLKNATADIVTPGGGGTFKQHMLGGKLYAVAKYHNNPCFDPTFQSAVYASRSPSEVVNLCRTSEEVITLSDAYSATPFTLNAGEEKELEFTFNTNAIPFSATDLYIQVVYRGKLGSEDDAVVVGTYDVSEPTFMTLANYTDVKTDVVNKTCVVNPPGLPGSPFDFDAKLFVLQGKLTDPGPPQYKELVVTRLDPGQYVRLAFLGDALEANMFARAYYTATRDVWFRMDNGVPAITSQVVIPTFFQRKDDGLLYYPNEEYKVREGYGHQWGVYNSRFLGSVFNLPTVGATYDDVVAAMKNCPGTMTLQPIVTLAF